jgi:Putative auto-transporter adhesin, head GIN domain
MKNIFVFTILLSVAAVANGQNIPLKGSGKIVTKSFAYTNFDKLNFADMDGKIEVEAGKSFGISIDIDDNFENLLDVSKRNDELIVKLKGNLNNRLYIEESNIKVTITMPQIAELSHRGNSTVWVRGITAPRFKITNKANGTAFLQGNTDELIIVCRGNGTVRAEALMAKRLTVAKSGNGNVFVKTANSFTATGSGNGDIINSGTGKADDNTSISGNGKVKYAAEPNKESAVKSEKVQLIIKNETAETVALTVKYPYKGSYGIDIKPGLSVKESFPAGTRLYRGGQFTVFKKPLYTVTTVQEQQFVIK